MPGRFVTLTCVLLLGAVAACSSLSTSDSESVGSSAQAITIDDGVPPVKKEPVIDPVRCYHYDPPARQCGTTYESEYCTDGTTSDSPDPACPASSPCGGVAGQGAANQCGNTFPPGCNALPSDSAAGAYACTGEYCATDLDPVTGQPFSRCTMSQTNAYLIATPPYFVNPDDDESVAAAGNAPALPCSVWDFVETDNEVDAGPGHDPPKRIYYVAYCLNNAESGPTGTVIGDWAYNVDITEPTHWTSVTDVAPAGNVWTGWVLTTSDPGDAGDAGVPPLAESDFVIFNDIPYNAQTTSQSRTLGPAAPGYVYVDFLANGDHGLQCNNTSDMPCIVAGLQLINPPTDTIETDPTSTVGGGF
jgi:hypothetical protein